MLPFVSLKFFPGIFFGEKSWKIPLGLTWSFKVVTLTSNFVAQLAHLNNDLISVKRLEEFYYLHWRHDQSKRVRVCKPFSATQEANAIKISNLSLTKGGVRIIRGLSLNLGFGERVAIIGNPSSGKHTIFKLIMGILQPD